LALQALNDPDGFVRATACKLLGDLGDLGSASALESILLEDPDPIARVRAAESLTRLDGPSAAETLSKALGDPMERVRLAAVEGLADLDASLAGSALATLLREDPAWEVRAKAAWALGLTRDPDARVHLEAALGDENEFVRAAAANALGLPASTGRKAPGLAQP
jgi:HEAT repeat protein